jgi:hypothetical protein
VANPQSRIGAVGKGKAVKLVLILALICGPLAYAARREYPPDPQPAFQRINAEYFAGQLPTPIFHYVNLSDSLAETSQHGDRLFVIELRPGVDLSVLRHEACHVATFDEAEAHGPLWTACMKRFPEGAQ